MIALALLLAAAASAHDTPGALVVATPRGESRLPVVADWTGSPVVAAPMLAAALNGSVQTTGAWAEVIVARQSFRFLLGASVFTLNDRLEPLAGAASIARDTLFLPLQFVAEVLPRVLAERFRYDPAAGRFTESVPAAATVARLPNGLLPGHLVTLDPGHGGVDPGMRSPQFPRGITESDITLQIGLLLRQELKRRGIGVVMTRTTDTLIDLDDRGTYCKESCDLFVSIHVNSLPRRAGYYTRNGFETYFLAEAKTEEAARVEQMENEAIRFERPHASAASVEGLDFILKDLQLNEYLRESARLAELIQDHLDPIHTGENLGVKQAGFRVLTTARRPAVLVELGYGTNSGDARLLTTPRGQKSLTAAVADAIVAYLIEYERKTGSAADSGARAPK